MNVKKHIPECEENQERNSHDHLECDVVSDEVGESRPQHEANGEIDLVDDSQNAAPRVSHQLHNYDVTISTPRRGNKLELAS